MKTFLLIIIASVSARAFAIPHLAAGHYERLKGNPAACDAHFTLASWRNEENKIVVQLGARFTYVWENVRSQERQDNCIYGTVQAVKSDADQSRLVLDETETCPDRSGDSQRDVLTLKDGEIDLDVKFLKPTTSGWAVDSSQQGYSCVWKRLP